MLVATKLEQRQRQAELGQFLTPAPVADFMASLFGPLPNVVRLLDAGAGAGALTTAFVARLCEKKDDVRVVEATLYEIDPLIRAALVESLKNCQLACMAAGIQFTFTVHMTDFIGDMSSRLAGDFFCATPPIFDVAIANPPYRKIGIESRERVALRSVGVETSNLYTAFIALIQRLLVRGGQLVAITPRSFCNGPYFRSFREEFLSSLELRRLHLFESRQAAFRDDNVLQESLIFHAFKGTNQSREVMISSSSGEHGAAINESAIPFNDVVYPQDAEKFIHIPSAPGHASAKETIDGLHCTLASLGITVSTGRVVDFRLKDALRREPEGGTVPLIFPCHFNGAVVRWPKIDGRKPNSILDNEQTRPWLVPTGVYLLTKRFTSKEERRRIVACLFDPEEVRTEWVGFENHLNYFHSGGRGLERSMALGLFAFLNSTPVDQYFRRFSGHTQVNATDLRKLAYPDQQTLQSIGTEVKALDMSQDEIDTLVARHLNEYR